MRWHYQWIVVHDFLPRIVGPRRSSTTSCARSYAAGREREVPRRSCATSAFYQWQRRAVHAGRVLGGGLSLRALDGAARYFINDFVSQATGGRLPIFCDTTRTTREPQRLRRCPHDWGIDWKPSSTCRRRQERRSRLQDRHELVNPLGHLPGDAVAGPTPWPAQPAARPAARACRPARPSRARWAFRRSAPKSSTSARRDLGRARAALVLRASRVETTRGGAQPRSRRGPDRGRGPDRPADWRSALLPARRARLAAHAGQRQRRVRDAPSSCASPWASDSPGRAGRRGGPHIRQPRALAEALQPPRWAPAALSSARRSASGRSWLTTTRSNGPAPAARCTLTVSRMSRTSAPVSGASWLTGNTPS